MDKKLNEIQVGKSVLVLSVEGEGRLRKRLFDMGVTPGAEITVEKKAPLGDPVEVLIRNYHLTLRKTEAALVNVKEVNE